MLAMLLPVLSVAGAGKPGTKERYVFFLHNRFLELEGMEGIHPEYGKAEYTTIISAFRKEGFLVLSELRGKDTDGDQYAAKVKLQVDSLLKEGVPPGNIAVIGTSKGAYIAWKVSALLRNKDVNFVIIGVCSQALLDKNPNDDFCGNILSIFEQSDELGRSCGPFKARSRQAIPHYQELTLTTGMKHGFLYKALPAWLNPAMEWAKGNYAL